MVHHFSGFYKEVLGMILKKVIKTSEHFYNVAERKSRGFGDEVFFFGFNAYFRFLLK
jgi:hypothetical protein